MMNKSQKEIEEKLRRLMKEMLDKPSFTDEELSELEFTVHVLMMERDTDFYR